eukprot:2294502-Prymnesium_polylepis.2
MSNPHLKCKALPIMLEGFKIPKEFMFRLMGINYVHPGPDWRQHTKDAACSSMKKRTTPDGQPLSEVYKTIKLFRVEKPQLEACRNSDAGNMECVTGRATPHPGRLILIRPGKARHLPLPRLFAHTTARNGKIHRRQTAYTWPPPLCVG